MLLGVGGRLSQRVDGLLGEASLLAQRGGLTVSERRQAEHIVYQMQNCWESFVRELILCSATGLYHNRSGKVSSSLGLKMRSKEHAASVLLKLMKKKREPSWYISTDAIMAATTLKLSNLPDIAAVLGSTPWPLNDLRLVRNFFAHRSKHSAQEVRNLPWFSASQAISVENTCFDFDISGDKRINSWGAFMKLAANQLI